MAVKWSESAIARSLQRDVFASKVCVVDNCLWTGFETDLLIVHKSMRLIDVEIKISRADFRIDRHKDKWIAYTPGSWALPRAEREKRRHPAKVWKHYYCLPESLWQAELEADMGSNSSGVILAREPKRGQPMLTIVKRAKTNPDAYVLTAADVLDIARLTSLRLWDARRGNASTASGEVAP